ATLAKLPVTWEFPVMPCGTSWASWTWPQANAEGIQHNGPSQGQLPLCLVGRYVVFFCQGFPAVQIRCNPLGEFSTAEGRWHGAIHIQQGSQLARPGDFVDGFVQHIDQVFGRAGRGKYTNPDVDVIARH